MKRQLIAGASIAWTVLGCGDFQAPRVPRLETDRAVYQLQPTVEFGTYKLVLTLTYTNRRLVPVYLVGVCGGSSPPIWSMGRADGSKEAIDYHGYGCIGFDEGPFTEVLPGATHQQSMVLFTRGPNAIPSVPMSVYIGTFYFEYQVVYEPKMTLVLNCRVLDCKPGLGTLLPEDERVSNTFQVLAP